MLYNLYSGGVPEKKHGSTLLTEDRDDEKPQSLTYPSLPTPSTWPFFLQTLVEHDTPSEHPSPDLSTCLEKCLQ